MSGTPHLFSPLTLRDITLRNRIAVSPMCQYSSEDGFANDWHLVHLGSRAIGGAGLVILEATAVIPEGRISPQDLGLWKDEHIAMLSRIAAFIKQQGAAPGIQIAHAGRKASTSRPWEGGKGISVANGGWQVEAPSAIGIREGGDTPHDLSIQEIKQRIQAFADAAARALKAGFEVLEIHAAHGYLIHEFLSPFSNTRGDSYGGSFENRIRFLTEIVENVRSVWPKHLPLLVRISASDWKEGGWTVEDSVALTRILAPLGVDLMDCSSGGIMPGIKVPVGPAYQTPFAQQIRKDTGIPTGAVGLITEVAQANDIIQSGKADLILLARELLRDPYWPMHAAQTLGQPVNFPPQYALAFK